MSSAPPPRLNHVHSVFDARAWDSIFAAESSPKLTLPISYPSPWDDSHSASLERLRAARMETTSSGAWVQRRRTQPTSGCDAHARDA
eukprot:5033056-Prymnesium_polylepis.2